MRRRRFLRGLAGLAAVTAAPRRTAAGPAPRGEAFNGTAAVKHVERLVALGPRPAGSPAGVRAQHYIVNELRRGGLEPRVERFEADTPHGRLRMANVVAVVKGRRPDVIMLAGHYDTKWFSEFRFVGANDGGSSTALMLELARVLATRPSEFTYWVVFFDGEEARVTWTAADSLYGSRHMAAALQRAGTLPRAMLLADMIGDRDLGIRREAYSTAWLTDLVWESARRLGHGVHFLDDTIPVEDDHVPFLRAGVPAAVVIDFDFPAWHTAGDTLDKVSARSLQVVGDVLLEALGPLEARLGGSPR